MSGLFMLLIFVAALSALLSAVLFFAAGIYSAEGERTGSVVYATAALLFGVMYTLTILSLVAGG